MRIDQLLEGETFQDQGAVILPLVAVFITTVGLLAALGPARPGAQYPADGDIARRVKTVRG